MDIQYIGYVFQPTFPLGDANHDGVVAADDFAYVQSHFGGSGEPGIYGDANWDGVVSADDFASIQAHFGNHLPEPTALALLLVGVGTILWRRSLMCRTKSHKP